ncbi:MAG TPA: DUF523 and DUF1722 domain-containing protein [Methylomirabilota bacterium]|nr:DUF523 and DUF1722 domain-containing protein [Methylomirabilota bacterium]
MGKIEPEKIRLGVSACLLGERVRYDGGHKRDAFLADTLGPFVEWVPVCPEVEIGLGVPRPTLRLVGAEAVPRLVVEKTGEDLSRRMRSWAEARVTELERLGLDGYVLKRGSPSCGLFRVRVYSEDGQPGRVGRGLYADALARRLPSLPVEEEGRLTDPVMREHFIGRVFATARWRDFRAGAPRPRDLVAFHTAHKYAVLAHSPARYSRLGRLVAAAGPALPRATLDEYGALLLEALAVRATRGRHANVLAHLAGYVKRDVTAEERAELAETIADYRRGLVPRVVPITLIRHHARRLGLAHLAAQVYLNPHPKELMLLNHA